MPGGQARSCARPARALTPEAKARRRALAEAFQNKALQCRRREALDFADAPDRLVSPAGFEPATY